MGSQNHSDECKHAQAITSRITGYQALVGAVVAFVLCPFLGTVSDAYGRRPVMFVFQFIGFVPKVLLLLNVFFDLSLWPYIATKAVSTGVTAITASYAYIADIAEGKERTKGFGMLLAAFSMAQVLGPVLATHCEIPEKWVYTFAAGVALLGILINLFFTGESLSDELQQAKRRDLADEYWQRRTPTPDTDASLSPNGVQPLLSPGSLQQRFTEPLLVVSQGSDNVPPLMQSQSDLVAVQAEAEAERPMPSFVALFCSNPFRCVRLLAKRPLLQRLAIILTCVMIISTGKVAITYFYIHRRFGMNQREHALMSMMGGGAGVLVQTLILHLLVRRVSNQNLLIGALLTQVVASSAYALMWTQWQVFFIVPVNALGQLAFPAISALKANGLSPDEQGEVQGALNSVRSLGTGLGPLIFAHLNAETQHSHEMIQAIPFWLAAALALFAVAVAWRAKEVLYQAPHSDDEVSVSEADVHLCLDKDELLLDADSDSSKPRAGSDPLAVDQLSRFESSTDTASTDSAYSLGSHLTDELGSPYSGTRSTALNTPLLAANGSPSPLLPPLTRNHSL